MGFFDDLIPGSTVKAPARTSKVPLDEDASGELTAPLKGGSEKRGGFFEDLIPDESKYDALLGGKEAAIGAKKRTPLEAVGRKVEGVASGAIGTLGTMAGTPAWLEASLGVKTPIGRGSENLSKAIQTVASDLAPTDPDFGDLVAQGFGSMGAFVVPGVASAKLISGMAKIAPRLATLTGMSVSSIMESATEAVDTFEAQKSLGLDERAAASKANMVFLKNLPLTLATNPLGAFAETGGLVKRGLTTAPVEGLQEYLQAKFQQQSGLPITEEDVRTSGKVGAVVGGGTGLATGAITRGRSLSETLAGKKEPPAENLPARKFSAQPEGVSPEGVVKSLDVPTNQVPEFKALGDRMGFDVKTTGLGNKMVRVEYFRRGESQGEGMVREPAGEKYQEMAPTFFSQVERSIQEKMPESAGAEQVRGILRGSGVKQEEVDWLDVEGFLAGKEKVSKQELLDYIRANNVQVQEVMKKDLPDGKKSSEAERDQIRNQFTTSGYSIESDVGGQPGDIEIIKGNDVVDHDDLPAELRDSAERFSELDRSMLDQGQHPDEPKFASYQLPGGENYRELLLTLPYDKGVTWYQVFDSRGDLVNVYQDKSKAAEIAKNVSGKIVEKFDTKDYKDGKVFVSPHFEEPNILAHVRMNDRVDADGKKVLFIEEVQSDWHQKGKKEGYARTEPKLQAGYRISTPRQLGWSESDLDNFVGARSMDSKIVVDERREPIVEILYRADATDGEVIREFLRDAEDAGVAGDEVPGVEVLGVPDAPFKKTWHELALKRMLRYAAENGYDRLAWTTGTQQNERYDLSKQVDQIGAVKNRNGTYGINAQTPQGMVTLGQDIPADKVADHVGKDLAQKILSQPDGLQKYSGLDLKVGGEGMKGFYDQILPSFLNKYAKKWGGRVGTTQVEAGKEVYAIYNKTTGNSVGGGYTLAAAKRDVYDNPNHEYRKVSGGRGSVHSLDITPAMKQAVLSEGQPLFQRGAGKPSTFKAEKAKLKLLFKRHGVKDIVIRLVPHIPTPTGKKAAGSYAPSERLVKLTPEPSSTTGYHEAFHALVREAGLEREMQEVFQETGVSDPGKAEEILAEQFAEYANREQSYRFSDKVRAFFERIMDFLRGLLGKGSKSRQLFRELLRPSKKVSSVRERRFGKERFQEKPSYEESERLAISGEGLEKSQKNLSKMLRKVDLKGAERRLARELYEKAQIMQQGGKDLFAAIRSGGGLKAYEGGHEAEEFRAIPNHLKRPTGQAMDEMAQELKGRGWPFEDDQDLYRAILMVGSLKRVTIKEFLPEAKRLVEQNAEELVKSEVLSKPQIKNARAAVRKIGRQLRRQQTSEMAKATAVLNAAHIGNLTPSQLMSYAKAFLGKKSGESISGKEVASLTAAMTKQKMDRETGDFKQESRFVPRQPQITGQPPKIPRSRSLTTLGPEPKRDLPRTSTMAISELDPIRAAEVIDGEPGGYFYQKFVEPVMNALDTADAESAKLYAPIEQAAGNIKPASKESAKVQDLAEKNVPIEQATPQEKALESIGRKTYDDLLVSNNEALTSLRRPTIKPIQNYATHFVEMSFMDSIFGGLENVPRAATKGNYSVNPQVGTPYFVFKRLGGNYTRDYLGGLARYIQTSMRLQHVGRAAKVASAELEKLAPGYQGKDGFPNAYKYFKQFLSDATGKPAALDASLGIPKEFQDFLDGAQRFSNMGLILGNVTTALSQFSSTGAGIAENGLYWQARGQARMIHPEAWDFVLTHSAELRNRVRFGTLLYKPGRPSRMANFLLELFDQYQFSSSWMARFEKEFKKGASFDQAVRQAEIAAVKTNASMRKALKSPLLRQRVLGWATQLQTFVVTQRQTFFTDPVLRSRNRGRMAGWWQLVVLIAATVAFNKIYDRLIGRKTTDWTDLVPFPLSVVAKTVDSKGRFVPAILRLPTIGFEALTRFGEKKEVASLFPEFMRAVMMYLPGGNQLYKTATGAYAIAKGGVFTPKGKLRYPVYGAEDTARALVGGPSMTTGAREWRERGFTPETYDSIVQRIRESKDPAERAELRRLGRQMERNNRRQAQERKKNRFEDLIPAGR